MTDVEGVTTESRLPDAVLRPLRGGNAFESTVEQLATAVRLGVFAYGEHLPPERELAERLGVSRMTLREAIAALRDSGLVTTRRGRGGGTFVVYQGRSRVTLRRPGVRHGAALSDLLDFRRVVEPGAAYLAAGRCAAGILSVEQREWLQTSVRDASSAPDIPTQAVADSRFHLAIATLSGSPMLIGAVTRAQAALQEPLLELPVLQRNISHSDAQHDAIATAVLAGRPEDARLRMEDHCDATAALLRGLLG